LAANSDPAVDPAQWPSRYTLNALDTVGLLVDRSSAPVSGVIELCPGPGFSKLADLSDTAERALQIGRESTEK
jgi:hypothetical protein